MPDLPCETSNVRNLPAPQTQQRALSPASLEPARPEERVSHLAACLALVRPAGMGDEAAEEWLAVAATTLADLPADILADAAQQARKSCRHHGQIVPAILEHAEERMRYRRTIHHVERVPHERRIEQQRWTPQEGEIERIKREVAERLRAEGATR